jgi:manganese efflux pump family protein
MDVAALIAWIVTASGGAIIVATWLAKGGAREPQDYAEQRQQARLGQRPTALGLTMHLVIPHGVLALVGLVLCIAFTSDNDAYSEARVIAPVAVVVVAAIGAWMLRRWRVAAKAGPDAAPAERDLPSGLVAVHGVSAVATVALVIVAAILSS